MGDPSFEVREPLTCTSHPEFPPSELSSASLLVPNEPFLVEVFRHWQESPHAIIIRDLSTTKEATCEGFLYDVLIVRSSIHASLSDEVQKRLLETDKDVFIAILAGAGYDFVVLFFAIFSLGAVVVPLCMASFPSIFTAVSRRQGGC